MRSMLCQCVHVPSCKSFYAARACCATSAAARRIGMIRFASFFFQGERGITKTETYSLHPMENIIFDFKTFDLTVRFI
jgi:hypothetical protein